MKRCEYCAKEITYHQMYCDDKCENNAKNFYKIRDKIEKIMGVINGICVMSIGVGFFAFSFFRELGSFMISIPLVLLGLLFFFFPIPADVMIQKHKIQKSVKMTKIIAIILLILGVIANIFAIFTTL